SSSWTGRASWNPGGGPIRPWAATSSGCCGTPATTSPSWAGGNDEARSRRGADRAVLLCAHAGPGRLGRLLADLSRDPAAASRSGSDAHAGRHRVRGRGGRRARPQPALQPPPLRGRALVVAAGGVGP